MVKRWSRDLPGQRHCSENGVERQARACNLASLQRQVGATTDQLHPLCVSTGTSRSELNDTGEQNKDRSFLWPCCSGGSVSANIPWVIAQHSNLVATTHHRACSIERACLIPRRWPLSNFGGACLFIPRTTAAERHSLRVARTSTRARRPST